jgi:hypothetical protein
MSYRHTAWLEIAALDEQLAVFMKLDEALERFLADFGLSSHEPYVISTDSGVINRPSRAQINRRPVIRPQSRCPTPMASGAARTYSSASKSRCFECQSAFLNWDSGRSTRLDRT